MYNYNYKVISLTEEFLLAEISSLQMFSIFIIQIKMNGNISINRLYYKYNIIHIKAQPKTKHEE